MALGITVQEGLKYRIAEGKYQRFMSWMGNAIMGRPNVSALVFEAIDEDAACAFLRRVLPGVRFLKRMTRSGRRIADNVVAYVRTCPKTHNQRDAVRAIMGRSSVIFVNPPGTFILNTTIPCIQANVFIDPFFLAHTAEFVAMAIRYNLVIHSFEKTFQHYDVLAQPNDTIGNSKQIIALTTVITPTYVSTATRKKRHLRPGEPRPIAYERPSPPRPCLIRFLAEGYDNGAGLFHWCARLFMGAAMAHTVAVVEDATGDTVEWVRETFAHIRTAIITDANVSMINHLADPADYKLYIFDRLTLPLVDIGRLTNSSAVIMIDRNANVSYDPRVTCTIRSRRRPGVSLVSTYLPKGLVEEVYTVTVKEPIYVFFVKKALLLGLYKKGHDYDIDDVVTDYVAFCMAHDLPPWLFIDVWTVRNQMCDVVSSYIPCVWDNAQVRFST